MMCTKSVERFVKKWEKEFWVIPTVLVIIFFFAKKMISDDLGLWDVTCSFIFFGVLATLVACLPVILWRLIIAVLYIILFLIANFIAPIIAMVSGKPGRYEYPIRISFLEKFMELEINNVDKEIWLVFMYSSFIYSGFVNF